MKRLVIVICLVAILLTTLSVGALAAEKNTTQKIGFNFNLDGYDGIKLDPLQMRLDYDNAESASAVLSGIIKDKGGTLYLSPLTGTITIDDIQHRIIAHQLKQSEPVGYFHSEGIVERQEWYCYVEVNIEGSKYSGILWWGSKLVNGSFYSEYSYIQCSGYENGEPLLFWLKGELPEMH
ncbi:hypothetical protein ACFLU8_01405 [Chloroflexota bacterium]